MMFGLAHAVVYSFLALWLWSAAMEATDAGNAQSAAALIWLALLAPLVTGAVAGHLAASGEKTPIGVGAGTGIVFSIFMIAVAAWTIRDVQMSYTGHILTMMVAVPVTAVVGGVIGGALHGRSERADDDDGDYDWLDDFDDDYVENVDGMVEHGGHAISETRHTELSRREQQQKYIADGEAKGRSNTSSDD